MAMNIRALRQSMGMNTEQFAEKVGTHKRTVERWEAGEVAPSKLALKQLRNMQHPDVPQRRPYEPQSNSSDTQAPPVAGGIIPGRRV